MRTHMVRKSLTSLAAGLMLVAGVAAAEDVYFDPGSLIIPEDSTFQTDCGSTSAYGLVYQLLRENQTGGAFGPTDPVTIYWIINEAKASPNRCVPTNLHVPPLGNTGGLSASVLENTWNDGCDLQIPNGATVSSTMMPVVGVDLSVTIPRSTALGPTTLYDPDATTSVVKVLANGTGEYPAYPATANLNNTATNSVNNGASRSATGRFTKVRYKGGPFVIAASDAERVINHMKDTTKRANIFGRTCSCTSFATDRSTCHQVNIHQALVGFTAPAYRRINKVPPRIAVLQSGPGVRGKMLPEYLSSAGLNYSGASGCPPNATNATFSRTCSVASGEIYDTFDTSDLLARGTFTKGLLNQPDPDAPTKAYYKVFWMPHWEIQASSCAAGTSCDDVAERVASACDSDNHDTQRECGEKICKGEDYSGADVKAAIATACNAGTAWGDPATAGTVANTIKGLISNSPSECRSSATHINNALARMQSEYQPGGSTCFSPTDAQRAQMLENISYFSDKPGTGLFAECAAIGSLEGANSRATASLSTTYPHFRTGGTRSTVTNTSALTDIVTPRFMYTNSVNINGPTGGWSGRNCTDPDFTATGGNCMFYPNAGNAFSQIADFSFVVDPGSAIYSYEPKDNTTPASKMKDGIQRLAVSYTNFSSSFPLHVSSPNDPSLTPTTAYFSMSPTSRNWDIFSVGNKDNDINKATVVYLGGHEYPDSVAGTRVVLNTLLNLSSDPVSADRTVTAPVAFDDANGTLAAGTRAILLNSTFQAISGTVPAGTEVLNFSSGSRFRYPYVRGDLRAHPIVGTGAMANGESSLDEAVLWSANARLPAPGARNIFSYIGGQTTDLSSSPLSGGRKMPHDLAQVGWRPLKVDQAEIVAPNTSGASPWNLNKNTGCTDELSYGDVLEGASHQLGLVNDSTGDGICDLQQLLNLTTLGPDASWHIQTADVTNLTNAYPQAKQLISLLRGFCYATSTQLDGSGTPVFEPLTTQCNGIDVNNVAEMGGLVNSTAAVIPASSRIPGAGGSRPTVAYVAGYDGMLHAIYVSGGAGYRGPNSTLHYPNADASSTFKTALTSGTPATFTPPAAGTELWSFMPSTMFPFVRSNQARLDSSPVVQDVFVDLNGSGVREWHTVLVQSLGQNGREIFAMDVTDPLKPVLLWDLVGSTFKVSTTPAIAATTGFANTDQGGTAYTYKWNATYDAISVNNTNYVLPPATDPGRTAMGLYNYKDLGATRSVSVGQLNAGLTPQYVVYVASNAPGIAGGPANGLEVFAIDVATGQKIWQWERDFLPTGGRPHNAVPQGLSLKYGPNGVHRVYVGDASGRVWELDAATGVNPNYLSTGCSGDCSLPAVSTNNINQPITSNIAIAKTPPTTTGDFASYSSQELLLFGTSGSSLVPANVQGKIHTVLTASQYRRPVRADGTHFDTGSTYTQTAAVADSQSMGLLQPVPNWPKVLQTDGTNAERVYGTITVAGQMAFVPAVVGGSVNLNDVMGSSITAGMNGKTYAIDLGGFAGAITNSAALSGFTHANFGGVAVYHTDPALGGAGAKDYVIGGEVSKLATISYSQTSGATAMTPTTTLNPNNTASGITFRLLNWMKRYLSN